MKTRLFLKHIFLYKGLGLLTEENLSDQTKKSANRLLLISAFSIAPFIYSYTLSSLPLLKLTEIPITTLQQIVLVPILYISFLLGVNYKADLVRRNKKIDDSVVEDETSMLEKVRTNVHFREASADIGLAVPSVYHGQATVLEDAKKVAKATGYELDNLKKIIFLIHYIVVPYFLAVSVAWLTFRQFYC